MRAEIGRIKQQLRIDIYQPARESEVLRHVQACTTAMGGPLSPAALARLFERIIDEARRLERQSAGRHDERKPTCSAVAPDAGSGAM